MKQIKAIETRYKGYKLRSRLEARWAIFFDALGIKWEYEPEGFHLPDGSMYLPDFRVTTPDGCIVFYEVKPSGTKFDQKFSAFKDALDMQAEKINDTKARLLCGDPMFHLMENIKVDHGICPRCGIIGEFAYGIERCSGFTDYGCENCDYHTPCGGVNDEENGLLAVVEPYKGWIRVSDNQQSSMYSKVKNACQKARSARFEHGEQP